MGRNVYLAVACVIWIAATGLYVTSMLTKHWRTNPIYSYNLFERCDNLQGCQSSGWNPEGQLHVYIPRILMLVAALCVAIGVLFGLIGFCCNSACLTITEGVLCIVGGMIIFAACAVFTGLTHNNGLTLNNLLGSLEYFDYSFYIGWASGAVYIIAGSIICRAGSVDRV